MNPPTDMAHSAQEALSFDDSVADSLQLAGKRAVAVVFSNYPADPRPRRGAEALVKEGMHLEVICLKETDEEPESESFNGVEITRIPLKRRRGGKLTYIIQYGSFVLLSGAILAVRACRRRYDLVHVHNMPDFLVFSALVPKMLGARVILDLHDPMPELMMTIFGLKEDSFSVRLLKILEKCSLRFADAVLTVNEACRKIFSNRSCSFEKVRVVMNSPDEAIFKHRQPSPQNLTARDNKPFVIMYHGSLVERHGLDLAVTALEKIRESIPRAELNVYGRSTPFLEQVMDSVRKSTLREAVRYLGPQKLEQIVEAIDRCNVGIIPNRRSIFTEINTPTRILEYLSRGKPVIAPATPGIQDYFDSQQLLFFEVGDADDLARKIEYVFSHPAEVEAIVSRGMEVYMAHQWTRERMKLVGVVEELLG